MAEGAETVSRMNPELRAAGLQVHPIPSDWPTPLRQVHSATSPTDMGMPAWPVVWHGGRRTDRKARVQEARERVRALAHELTESDMEAAEVLGLHVRTYRSWRLSRHLWSKYVRTKE